MDWPKETAPVHGVIAAGGYHSMGDAWVSESSSSWGTANLARYVPFVISEQVTAKGFAFRNGGTVNGTVHVGIYNIAKSLLVSNSAAHTGTNAMQTIDITDTVLVPGFYWMAMAITGTTGVVFRVPIMNELARSLGFQQQASAVPLPSTATFSNPTSTLNPAHVPALTITTQSTV